MKVATRLALSFGLLLTVLVGLLLYQLSVLHGAVQTSQELSGITTRLTLASTDLLGHLDRLEEDASKYMVTLEPGYAERYEEARESFERTVVRLQGLPLTGAERTEVRRLATLWDVHVRESPSLENRALQARLLDLAGPLDELTRSIDRLRYQTRRVSRASQDAMARRIEHSAAAAARAERISWIAAGLALLLCVFVSWRIVRSISDSLLRLKEGTRRVAGGDFSYRLEAGREDEFSELARDFNVMTARLGELDRAKQDFLSQVSHDLKTPLASMQETTQLLLEGLAGTLSEKQRRLLELNQRSVRRLSAMIAKLLDLARMDAGALEYDFRTLDLVSLVRLVLEEFVPRAAERSITVRAVLPGSPLPVKGDADRLVQLLANLLENAIKFSSAGSTVCVALEDRGAGEMSGNGRGPAEPAESEALLSVEDEGPGVPDAEKEKIFERFHQARKGKGTAERGVGLGLALCREIAHAHRGHITVHDRSGGGSRFTVRLPTRTQQELAPVPHAVAAVATE